jgi:hypothetical protein
MHIFQNFEHLIFFWAIYFQKRRGPTERERKMREFAPFSPSKTENLILKPKGARQVGK